MRAMFFLIEWEPCSSWKEPCPSWKEPCSSWKEPCSSWKEPCSSWKEPCSSWKEPIIPCCALHECHVLPHWMRAMFFMERAMFFMERAMFFMERAMFFMERALHSHVLHGKSAMFFMERATFLMERVPGKSSTERVLMERVVWKEWQRWIGYLILIGHFPQKNPIPSGSFAKRDLQLKASYASSPPCTWKEPCCSWKEPCFSWTKSLYTKAALSVESWEKLRENRLIYYLERALFYFSWEKSLYT